MARVHVPAAHTLPVILTMPLRLFLAARASVPQPFPV